jgi:2-polyprenyl-3-methyl-5-hydroxy-6-metoxy-1,4-benzoquinol methylase
MTVPYHKQTVNTPNPIARFAHKARYKHSLELAQRHLSDSGTLLDIGCGDGTFLHKLAAIRPMATLLGYEPSPPPQLGTHATLNDLNQLPSHSIDVICCFETLEHLYDEERNTLYASFRRLLRNEGTILVSVPIIGGPTLLLKELNRAVLFRRRSDYTIPELLRASLLGISASRSPNPRITHKGFNFRQLWVELENHHQLLSTHLSPFSRLPAYFNSQIFFVLRTKIR